MKVSAVQEQESGLSLVLVLLYSYFMFMNVLPACMCTMYLTVEVR